MDPHRSSASANGVAEDASSRRFALGFEPLDRSTALVVYQLPVILGGVTNE
jgi:hypothetical protein